MQDVQALNETVERLQRDLEEEKLRVGIAERRQRELQADLELGSAPLPEPSADVQHAKESIDDDTSSALWQELDVARGDAASAKASAAEARANAESAAAQLEHLQSSHAGFLHDIQRLLCDTDDVHGATCQGLLTKLERVLQQRRDLEDRLSDTRTSLAEEQGAAVQVFFHRIVYHCFQSTVCALAGARGYLPHMQRSVNVENQHMTGVTIATYFYIHMFTLSV